MLVELSLRKRIELEKSGARKRSLLTRKVHCKDPTPTGDVILDEALKHIKETSPPLTAQNWVELLSGEVFVCVWGGGSSVRRWIETSVLSRLFLKGTEPFLLPKNPP